MKGVECGRQYKKYRKERYQKRETFQKRKTKKLQEVCYSGGFYSLMWNMYSPAKQHFKLGDRGSISGRGSDGISLSSPPRRDRFHPASSTVDTEGSFSRG